MKFKVVPTRHDDTLDDAVLSGIAHGLSELFPVPQHPGGVLRWLGSPSEERIGFRDQGDGPGPAPGEMFDEA
jgi:hypothetical protein